MLGYNSTQIRTLQSIYTALEEGNAINAKWNDDSYPFYKHYARFENRWGIISVSFSGNNDFKIGGYVNEATRIAESFPVGSHPQLFVLKKVAFVDIDLGSIGKRIFRGDSVGEITPIKRILSKVGVAKEIPAVKHSFEAYWLDERSKMDAVFFFPATDEYMVFRKIYNNQGYETWGRRMNMNSDQIKRLSQSRVIVNRLIFNTTQERSSL
jgi:hypothetical protein